MTDYSTNELNQYFLVTREQDDLGAVSRHCSNMRYDHDGNLTEMWHVDATNTFRGGFVGDMTGPTADRTSEVASTSMKRIAPMKMASEETGYESEELLFTEGSLAISLTPLGGGQVGTTLQPHTTYWMTYTTDTSATDFVVVASAESAAQGLQAALAPYSGDWSDNTNFAYVDLESLFGSLDDSGDTRLVKTDIITNHLTSPAGTSGKLCRFTTGDAGELRLHVELIASDSQTNQIDLRTITLNLEVVDSVVQGNYDAHENMVLAASGSSSMIGNRDSSSAEIGWPVEGDAAPQLLAWYTHDNGQEDSSALASLTAHTSSSISEDLLSTTDSIFAAPDFSLAMLASILGQTSVTNYDFNNDGDVDIRDYAALMLMGQSQEDKSLLLTWDAENRLVSVEPQIPADNDTKVTFAYDYMGRRIARIVQRWDGNAEAWGDPETNLRYVYDGWRVIGEGKATYSNQELIGVNYQRRFTWGLDLSGSFEGAGGIGGLLAMDDNGGPGTADDAQFLYFYDANGNVTQVLKFDYYASIGPGDLEQVAHYEYSPYGQRVNNADSEEYDQPFRFSTKMFGSETEIDNGFGYWGYRYYSPELGRWLNRDPIGESGGYNIYTYCIQNPVCIIDLLGCADYKLGRGSRPVVTWDNHFKYDPTATATRQDAANWLFYNYLLLGAEKSGHLPDGTKAYRNYLYGKGKELRVNYEKAIVEDRIVARDVKKEIEGAILDAEKNHDGKTEGIFYMHSTAARTVSQPATENWQKAIGGHAIWGNAIVFFNECEYQMDLFIDMEDFYNFNKAQADKKTGYLDRDNGRFQVLGLAHPFFSRAQIHRIVRWKPGKSGNYKLEVDPVIMGDK